MFYNCSSLDHIIERSGGAVVHMFIDGENTSTTRLDADEATRRMAGLMFRKYVEGERIRVRFRYDYSIGARLLEYVNYGNGCIERWSWE